MKRIITLLLLVIAIRSFAQPTDLSTLPSYDCSLKKVMGIISKPTILLSSDNSKGLESAIADYCGTLGDNCLQKKERALSTEDYANNILLVGVCSDFKKWKKLNIPIQQTAKGFIINNKLFNDPLDGFVYVDSTKIVVSGNSVNAVKDAQLALTGGHDILIVQHGKITYFGNQKGRGNFDWYNLQLLKQTNYVKKTNPLFSAVYVSQTFTDSINYKMLYKELSNYVQQFLQIYHLKMPVKKVSWFIHSNMQEYGTMSGMFGLTCPGNNSAGFSIRGEIHTNGFNTGLVKHEYSHYLFDNTIPQDHNPAFFVEGCVEYVTNLNDHDLYQRRLTVAKQFQDTLNYTDLILNNRDFYGQYSEANYSVCGIFVKYIMEKYGATVFKKYCLIPNKALTTKDIFKIDFDELVGDYKRWLRKQ